MDRDVKCHIAVTASHFNIEPWAGVTVGKLVIVVGTESTGNRVDPCVWESPEIVSTGVCNSRQKLRRPMYVWEQSTRASALGHDW